MQSSTFLGTQQWHRDVTKHVSKHRSLSSLCWRRWLRQPEDQMYYVLLQTRLECHVRPGKQLLRVQHHETALLWSTVLNGYQRMVRRPDSELFLFCCNTDAAILIFFQK